MSVGEPWSGVNTKLSHLQTSVHPDIKTCAHVQVCYEG
jgi:hypothetical protein